MTMHVLPACPSCQENELFLVRHQTWVTVRCYNCGWNHTLMPRPAEEELHAEVAREVEDARPSDGTAAIHV